MNPDLRDPLVDRLLGPGKLFELEEVDVAGIAQQVFKGEPRTLAGIYQRALQFGPRCLVEHDGQRLTYDEVFAEAASLARALRERFGVTRGTRVAVVMGNRAEWIVSLIAITAAGGVAALVNSRGVGEELLRAIATVSAEVVIVDVERAGLIAAERSDPAWPRIVIGGEANALRPGRDADFKELTRAHPGERLAPLEMRPEDGALVLFTSGTTGFPKGALISHGALTHAVALAGFMGTLQDLRYEEEMGESLPTDRRSMGSPVVILGPMFHLGGMLPTVRGIRFGATVYIMSKWNADVAFDMIERVGISRLAFVPAMLWDMLRSPKAGPANIGKILYLSNGAASLDPALVSEIRRRMPQCLLANTYGQSETTAWACSISGQAYFDHPDSCGWPVPTVRVRVRRDDGADADPGEPGELWVSSPSLMSEYVGDPAATAATIQDGWLATGDIGVFDPEGLFSIVDRKKSMVISGGENIYCAEVERVLAEHPGVIEAFAFGMPDTRLGERLEALVVVEPGAELDEEILKAGCRRRLAIYKVPRAITLTFERLPRTATGKHDRGLLLRRMRKIA